MNDRHHTPKHCLHKPSGLGYVRLNGKCHYTAKWGTLEAGKRYDLLLATWLANGRVPEVPVIGLFERGLLASSSCKLFPARGDHSLSSFYLGGLCVGMSPNWHAPGGKA